MRALPRIEADITEVMSCNCSRCQKVGSLLAAAVFRFVLEPGGVPPTESPEPIKTASAS